MLLKQIDEPTQSLEQHDVLGTSALATRLKKPISGEREVQPVEPTSRGFLIGMVAFICVVLLTACAAIVYHEQQREARVTYDANQKKLLAEYRRNDSWRPVAIALADKIQSDLQKAETMPIHNWRDFEDLKQTVDRIKSVVAKTPLVGKGLIGPGAAWPLTLRWFGSNDLNEIVRHRGCALLLETDSEARAVAETYWALHKSNLYLQEHPRMGTYWASKEYGKFKQKQAEFREQAHKLGNQELKKAVLQLDTSNWYSSPSFQYLLDQKPYVPYGLDLDYARRLP